MRCRPWRWILLLIPWALSGCSGDHAGRVWAGEVIDSAGVSLIRNPSKGVWGESQAWKVEEVLRIGDLGGDPSYQFGQVGSIAVSTGGEIFVMDRQVREVRVYSSSGDYLRSMGSPGTGPGEFSMGVTDVLVGPGDTVLIPDTGNRRIHRFLSNGRLVGSTPLDVDRFRFLRFRWNASTRRAAVQLRPVGSGRDPDEPTSDLIRLLETSGEMGEILLNVPSGGLFGPNVVRYFTPEPTWTLTDSLTVLYAVNNEFRIGVYDGGGRLKRVISKPTSPRPITDRDIRAFFAYLDRAWVAAGVPPSRLEENHRRVSFAETFPAFYSFEVGIDGSLWVQPVQAPGELSDEQIDLYNFIEDFGASGWEVFDREGRFLGVVNMPPRFQPRLFVDDLIYGVARDELDVQNVVVLRVRG